MGTYLADATALDGPIPTRKLIGLTDDEALADANGTLAAAITANSAIDTRILRAITDAEAQVNGYLRKQIATPVSPVPDLVVRLTEAVAVYNLFRRRRTEYSEIPKAVKADYDDAMTTLRDVSRGTMDLGEATPPADSPLIVATTGGEDRAFTATTLEDY
ncbi:MAG: DUF1320 domain-containing protein [Myxococcales bacterium]|nr:DUF1320 domain-containing protein [Myxococcales bacterium]